jgi:transcriptional regulator of aromatic amino acid metabolism
MNASCRVCGAKIVLDSEAAQRDITSGICDSCAIPVSGASDFSALLESIDAPVLLMQGNPKQVIAANRKALVLFGKDLHAVESHRGGQVFDCVHAFTEAGCGKDENCEGCEIKNAVVDTFTTGNSHKGVSAELSVKKGADTKTYILQVSTEKVGDFALIRIERYDADA